MSVSLERLKVAYDLEQYDKAIGMAHELIASTNEEEAHHILIRSLIVKERLDEALESLRYALGHFTNDAYLLYLQAEIYTRKEMNKEALQSVCEVLAMEPNAFEYHHLHAKILLDLSRSVEAKRAIDKALAIEPLNPDLHCTLAIITYALDNAIVACEIVEFVLANHPHHLGALGLKSQICVSSLSAKDGIIGRILFQNPFSDYANKKHKSIRLYYRIAPVLMAVYLFSTVLFGFLDEWKSMEGSVLLVLSLYVWQDWRLSLPFFALAVVLGGHIEPSEWFFVPFFAFIYYFMGRVGGILLWRFFEFLKTKVEKWKSR